ncbi:MAG: hypothetical protein K0R00_193 [Herbinix sp.]|jgi:N-acetylmuramoyl-L-alanine amidase|nr:hypothetical protein [Herbinix sp.]
MSFRVAIDAGHGSNTAGKRTPPMPTNIDFDKNGKTDIKKGQPIKEHTANVGVALFLNEELQRCGIKTFKTGWNDADSDDDADTALSARQSAIAKADCDLVVSVHFNAFGDGKTFNTAKGIGIYIHDQYAGDSKKLGDMVMKHLAQGTKQTNRGVTPDGLAMVNCPKLQVKAAILVELAFMTNLAEATNMVGNVLFWRECAIEIAKGVCEYLKVDYTSEKPATKTVHRVQVGAFENYAYAENLLKKVKAAGFPEANINSSEQ